MAERTLKLPWLKIWVDMPGDLKIRQLKTREKWIWVTLLCLTRRSPGAPEVWYQDTEDSPWRPATIADVAKEARLDEADWCQEDETRYTGLERERFTKTEFLVHRAIYHFTQLDMVLDEGKVLKIRNFTKRQHYEIKLQSGPLGPELDIPNSGGRGIEEKKSRGVEEKTKRTKRCVSGQPRNEFSGLIYEIYEYWQKVMGKQRALLTPERRTKIDGRLKEGYTIEQCKAAIDGCRSSDFHMGKNERGTVYIDIELIFRNGTKLEQFAERAEKKGGLTYGSNGKLSNRLAGGDREARIYDPEAEKRLKQLALFGEQDLSQVQHESQGRVPRTGSGEAGAAGGVSQRQESPDHAHDVSGGPEHPSGASRTRSLPLPADRNSGAAPDPTPVDP